MQTVHLPDEIVDSYLREFAGRLAGLGATFPRLWVGIRDAGSTVARRLLALSPSLQSQVRVADIDFDRNNRQIVFLHEEQPDSFVRNERVLVLDGSVLSGTTLTSAIDTLVSLGAAEVSSYALVVRRGASIIPNHFGLLLGDHDKALFLRRECPTQRLSMYGTYRQLADSDLDRPCVVCGEAFIDKFDWYDYWYELQVDPARRTYIYEHSGAIRALVSFVVNAPHWVLLDTIGVERRLHGQGIGGHLMRWVENYAQHADCADLRLWAVDSRVVWYQGYGFKSVGPKLPLGDHDLCLMHKRLGYRFDSRDGSFGL